MTGTDSSRPDGAFRKSVRAARSIFWRQLARNPYSPKTALLRHDNAARFLLSLAFLVDWLLFVMDAQDKGRFDFVEQTVVRI